MMICDEINPTCLIKVCCSEKCELITKEIDTRFKNNSIKDYLNILTNDYCCPICYSDTFDFLPVNSYPRKQDISIRLNCVFCNSIFYIEYNCEKSKFKINSIHRNILFHTSINTSKLKNIINKTKKMSKKLGF